MSFDADLDYSEAVTKLGRVKDSLDARVVDIDAEIGMLSASVGYEALLANRITALHNVKVSIQAQIATIVATLAEIIDIQALLPSQKLMLYEFYVASEISANKFMQLMLFNTTAMLADADIAAILADSGNPCKCHICQSILIRYPINPTNTYAIMMAFL